MKNGQQHMPRVPGLVRQGGTYWYRRRVPVDIQAVLGKKELWLPLGPGDYSAKVRASRIAAVRADAILADARRVGRGGAVVSEEAGLVSEAELRQWAMRVLWEKERSASTTNHPPDDPDEPSLADELRSLIAALRASDHMERVPLLEETIGAIKRLGIAVPLPPMVTAFGKEMPQSGPLAPQLVRAYELVRRANIEHYQRQLARLTGGHGETAYDPLFADVTSASSEAPAAIDRVPTLIRAIRRFGG